MPKKRRINFQTAGTEGVLNITLVFTLIALGMSYKIWMGNEFVPRFPIHPNLAITDNVSAIQFGVLILGGLWMVFSRPKKGFLSILLLVGMAASISDWNKVQPYFVMYFLFILLYIISKDKKDLWPYILALSGIYLWSGINKLNVFYYEDIVYDLASSFSNGSFKTIVIYLGKSVPFIEIFLAIALIFKKTQKLASILAIGLHLGILVLLINMNHNTIVWPWNVCMILIHFLIYKSVLHYRSYSFAGAVAATCFILMPIIGLISSTRFAYVSWDVYSGKIPYGSIYYDKREINHLSSEIKSHLINDGPMRKLHLISYSLNTTGVAINPEVWIYKRWLLDFCADKKERQEGPFLINYSYTFTKRKQEVHSCQ